MIAILVVIAAVVLSLFSLFAAASAARNAVQCASDAVAARKEAAAAIERANDQEDVVSNVMKSAVDAWNDLSRRLESIETPSVCGLEARDFVFYYPKQPPEVFALPPSDIEPTPMPDFPTARGQMREYRFKTWVYVPEDQSPGSKHVVANSLLAHGARLFRDAVVKECEIQGVKFDA